MSGIVLASSFTENSALPLDDRCQVADDTARNAIVSGRRWEGMQVYVLADKITYALVGGILDANWLPVGSGAGGGPFGVTATSITSTTTLAVAAGLFVINATSGSINITFPTWADKSVYGFKRIDSVEANTVTITAAGTDTIDAATTFTLPLQNASVVIAALTSGLWGTF
ncbi:MAG: hypothetical protein ABI351_02340 [Herbaspirillum sp.]